MKPLLVTAALLSGVGCHTLATNKVSSIPTPNVRVGSRTRVWEVRSGSEPLGLIILFQEHGLARDSVYVVRNPWHQDLGLIDGLGRAYRYLPHREEPAWVGSGTIVAGAQRILGALAECELYEIDPSLGPVSGTATPSAAACASRAIGSAPDAASTPLPDDGLPQSR